jgi:TrmH family RNA methyltransferase
MRALTPADENAAHWRGELKRAHQDDERVVLEGFHALKHALRFGAAVEVILAADPRRVLALARDLAPDLEAELDRRITVVEPSTMKLITPNVPYTGVIAIARKPEASAEGILAATREAPVILLENPRHFGNMGAVVRVAAAADVAGVLTTGVHDPWDPAAVRGAAGLHFAVPVARLAASPPHTTRQVVALTPEGEPIQPSRIDDGALLAFGTERDGLSAEMLRRADICVRLPMREGVSSLNLATSVAATLYGLAIARSAT